MPPSLALLKTIAEQDTDKRNVIPFKDDILYNPGRAL
jgi:hypothetical protein